jgi:protein-disulfide isomerase
VAGYLFVLSTLALAVILYLGYASFVIVHAVCIMCLITYAAVIGLFIISGAATSFPMSTLPRRAANDVRVLVTSPLAIALLVLFAAGAVSTLAFFPREGSAAAAALATPTADQRSELERFMAAAPRVPLVIPTEGAKVLIVKFNDYQCPACSQSYQAYKPIFAKYAASNPGAVRLVMKDYPLNPSCNANVPTVVHSAACEAAVAVRLARQHNRGPEMEEWLYTHQAGMTPPVVRQAAHDIGEVNDFDAKYASTIELVKGDIALGAQLGVRGTPTFFINGVKFDSAIQPQYFDQAIAYELAHANHGQ